MVAIILSVIFLLFAALFCFLGFRRGKKYFWGYSAVRIVGIVASVILATLLSVLIARGLSGLVYNTLLPSVKSENFHELLDSLPSAAQVVRALVSMVIAPIIFYILFPIVRKLLGLLDIPLARLLQKLTGKKSTAPAESTGDVPDSPAGKAPHGKKAALLAMQTEGPNVAGAVCGAVCAFLTFCAFLIPAVGGTRTTCSAVATFTANSDQPAVRMAAEVSDGMANNLGTLTVRAVGGDAVYSCLTSARINGQRVTMPRESAVLASLGNAVYCTMDSTAERSAAASAIRDVSYRFERSTLIPTVTSELLAAATDSWLDGKEYCGIKAPNFGGDIKPLTDSVLRAFKGSDSQTLKEDVSALTDAVATLVEKNAVSGLREDPLALFSDEELTSDVLYDLLSTDRMYLLVGGVSEYGTRRFCLLLGAKESYDPSMYLSFTRDLETIPAPGEHADVEEIALCAERYRQLLKDYALPFEDDLPYEAAIAAQGGQDMVQFMKERGVVSSQEDMEEKCRIVTADQLKFSDEKPTDTRREADLLALSLSSVAQIYKDVNAAGDAFRTEDMVVGMGPLLDSFAASETVGKKNTALFLRAVMQSDRVTESSRLSLWDASSVADSVNDGAQTKGYTPLMLSLSHTLTMLRNASDGQNTLEAVEALLKDLTPEAARTIQNISTPGMMRNYGVPDRSADATAGLVSDLFGNLSDAKENQMSEEELNRETAAVDNVMKIAMDAGKSSSSTTFGEGSATGVTAGEYVSSIMDSEVVSKTVTDKVYDGGTEARQDPLNSGRQLSDTEKSELSQALNDTWNSATDEERADEGFRQKLVAVGALVNVKVTVDDHGVSTF